MITYGFFNSVNGDRKYNADTVGKMFEGLISEGVYESVGQKFKVDPGTGMSVTVGTGRAIVDTKWVRSDAAETLSITAAHVTLNRYTAIVLRHNIADRTVTLEAVDGTPASTPSVPTVVRNSTYYDIMLAYVYVAAGATSISAANITDTRTDTTRCGWVTGLIDQVDTSELFSQYEAAYQQSEAAVAAWESTLQAALASWQFNMENSFEAWFSELAASLEVGMKLKSYALTGNINADKKMLFSSINDYYWGAEDVFLVSINGLTAVEGSEYRVSSEGVFFPQLNYADADYIEIRIIKPVYSQSGGGLKYLLGSVDETVTTGEEALTMSVEAGKNYLFSIYASKRGAMAFSKNTITGITWGHFSTQNVGDGVVVIGAFTATQNLSNQTLVSASGSPGSGCIDVRGVWESPYIITSSESISASEPTGTTTITLNNNAKFVVGVACGIGTAVDDVALSSHKSGDFYVSGTTLVVADQNLAVDMTSGYATAGGFGQMQIGLYQGTGAAIAQYGNASGNVIASLEVLVQ